VFTPLYSSKQESGTGLGLAVVHHVMEVHEGEAVLDDAPGPGANFILRFPLDTE